MKRVTIFMTAAVLVLLAVFSLPATAQQPDTRDRTIMTFSNAVELPGMRLEAGTYVFRLADTPLRNVIQLLSSDEMNVLGQWLFVPAERQEVTGDTVVTFRETAANTTPAVQFWYYPGETIGKEFIYPKDQAMRIAQRSGAAVMSEDGRVTADAQVAASTTQSPSSVQAEAQVAPAQDDTRAAAAVGTSGEGVRQEGTIAQNTPAQTDPYAQDNRGARNELPATASPLALSGLLGLLSLAGAMGLRAFRL
jgi:hypothetical protein